MKRKIKVAVLFGGRSAEHEVSLQSAKNIIAALDKEKYEVIPIGIDKKGRWLMDGASGKLLTGPEKGIAMPSTSVVLMPDDPGAIVSTSKKETLANVDVVFPMLHGPYGEDGTIQGLLKLANVPFVGAGVLGSAVGMDKDVMKRLLREARIPVARFITVRDHEKISFEQVKKTIGIPCFVKPANLGSSVGVSKVKNKSQFKKAVAYAFRYDTKILIEEYIKGRELECSVLGNENRIASVAGEIIPQHEFYSYEAKYLDENGAILKVPADISKKTLKGVQKLAVDACKTLCIEDMARVDFFLKKNGELVLNEVNTIPGFTAISMYPKLWEASGISYTKLLDTLIGLALKRFNENKHLSISYI